MDIELPCAHPCMCLHGHLCGGRGGRGGGVAYSNCLANALDDFFFQPFLAFPSISLHDVSKGEKGNEPKHP